MGVALTALFVALGGTSYAVATGSIDSREIKNNTVRSKDILNDSVLGNDVKSSTLTSSDVKNDSLSSRDVRDNSLSGFDVAPNSVSGDELVRNSVNADELEANSINSDEVRDGGIRGHDIHGSVLNPIIRVGTTIVGAGVSTSQIASCAVGERAIAGGYNTPQVPATGLTAIANGPTSFVSGSEATGGVATAWVVHVYNNTGATVNLRVYVTCVRR